ECPLGKAVARVFPGAGRAPETEKGCSGPSQPHRRARHGRGDGDPGDRMRKRMALGPVVLDPTGLALTDEDRRRLLHPATGGVILFAHNYESPAQLENLTNEIRALRTPELIICVDHE